MHSIFINDYIFLSCEMLGKYTIICVSVSKFSFKWSFTLKDIESH
jgi:hypothetical protein